MYDYACVAGVRFERVVLWSGECCPWQVIPPTVLLVVDDIHFNVYRTSYKGGNYTKSCNLRWNVESIWTNYHRQMATTITDNPNCTHYCLHLEILGDASDPSPRPWGPVVQPDWTFLTQFVRNRPHRPGFRPRLIMCNLKQSPAGHRFFGMTNKSQQWSIMSIGWRYDSQSKNINNDQSNDWWYWWLRMMIGVCWLILATNLHETWLIWQCEFAHWVAENAAMHRAKCFSSSLSASPSNDKLITCF